MAPSTDGQNFALMTGGASAALTGLLFVAVSLNASRIAGHQGLRASAAQTLVLFLAPLAMAVVLLVPSQSGWVLGAELIAAGAGLNLHLVGFRRFARPGPTFAPTSFCDVLTAPVVRPLLAAESPAKPADRSSGAGRPALGIAAQLKELHRAVMYSFGA